MRECVNARVRKYESAEPGSAEPQLRIVELAPDANRAVGGRNIKG